jgi:hypothetical protein
METLRHLQRAVARGWPVFPAGPDKAPLTARGFKDASRDKSTIMRWHKAHPGALWATPTGEVSGLLVLDIDPAGAAWYAEHAAELQCGYIVKTPRGHHLYYTMPQGQEVRNSASKIAPGVDIRASGGYVIAWAMHGHETVGEPDDIGPPPEWLLRQAANPAKAANVSGEISEISGISTPLASAINEGGRNDHLARLAGMLAGQGYDGDAVLAAVRAENAHRCRPRLDDDEIQRTVAKSIAKWAEQAVEQRATAEGLEPEPLRRPVPPAPDYPIGALGPILGPAAQRLAEVVQSPHAVCGQSILAAASLAAQAHADIVIDGRREPLSLWCLTIAESGERKSAADEQALAPHRVHERNAAEAYRLEDREHAAELEAYEAAKRGATKSKDPAAVKHAVLDIGAPPAAPLQPWMLVSTPTLEGLHKLYRDGQPSLGLFHDDGGEFLGGHSMGAEHRMKSAAGMSKLWDRGEFDRFRATDGMAKYYGRRLALHLMVQPVVAEDVLSDGMLTGQGFLARCLIVWPVSRIGARQYAEADLGNDAALIAYRNAMQALLERPAPTRPDAVQELEPRELQLAPDAKRAWVSLHDAIETSMAAGGELSTVRAWGSKAPAQVLRVAGVLTLVSDPAASMVQADAIEAASQLVLHALEEAVRLVGTAHESSETRNAQALLDWCHESGNKVLHSSAALQFGPNCIRTKERFDEAVRQLERTGWAAPVPGGAEIDGKVRRRVWEIHP